MKAPVLPPDLREPREAAYRAFIAVVDEWVHAHDIERDPDAELLALAEQEIVSEAMRQVYRVLTGGPDRTERIALLRDAPAPAPAWKQAARFGLSLLRKRPHYRPPALFRPDRDICVFHNSAITAAYARHRGIEPCLMTHGDWFHPSPEAATRGAPLSPEIEQMLTRAMQAAFAAAGIRNDEVLAQSIARFSIFARWIDYHRAALRASGRKLPREFWSGTMGFPLNRIFAQAIRRSGGTVIGFDHGAGSGICEWDYPSRIELNFLNRYVAFTPAMADAMRQNLPACARKFPGLEIFSLTNPRPHVAMKFDRSEPHKLLYVSRSYWGENFSSPPLGDNERLKDWQQRLVAALKSTGLPVGIKPHPEDALFPAEQFRAEFGIEIFNGHFEAHNWSNTILVFDTTLSSTFPWALGTGLPIIVFDTPHVPMRAAPRELLARRVALASVWYDEDTRLQTDWSGIPQLLDRSIACRLESDFQRTFYGLE